jgi:uroporphyrinogen-III synthase
MTGMRVLVTRPEPDAQRTAAALRARGHEALVAPLLRFEALAGTDLDQQRWAGVLVTSANALRALAQHPALPRLTALPLLAVGRRTAEAARAGGFGDVTAAAGDGSDLARRVKGQFAGTATPLLYLAAADRAADLEAELARCGVPVHTAVVYRMAAATTLGPAAKALAARAVDAVLHYSRRSAETYLRCAGNDELGEAALLPRHLCLSHEVAAPLARAGTRNIEIASGPDEAALLDLVGAG